MRGEKGDNSKHGNHSANVILTHLISTGNYLVYQTYTERLIII